MKKILRFVGIGKGSAKEIAYKLTVWSVMAGLLCWNCAFAIDPPLLFAQEDRPLPAQGAGAAAEAGTAPKEADITAKEDSDLISLDLEDVPLGQLLKKFSDMMETNIVASDAIRTKKITIYLKNVTVENALNVILKANGMVLEEQPDEGVSLIKESGESDIASETKVYQLNYATVSGAEISEMNTSAFDNIISQLLSKDGTLVVDSRTNSLIVTDTPANLEKIEKVIKELDIKTEQVMICAEIIEVNVGLVDRLGIQWGSSATGQFASFSAGSRSTYWPFKESLFKGVTKSATIGSISFANFTAILEALKTDTDTHYLARPRLLTLNNTTAEINITKNAAVATTTVTTGGGSGITQSTETLERYDVGTTLKVTPHINKEGYIVMTVEPEVSRVAASSWNSTYFDPFSRSAKTTVMVKDGETAVLAGLISREDTDTKRKVPILGELPILGKPFRKDVKQKDDTEIVIFITPYIVKDTPRETAMLYDVALQMQSGYKQAGVPYGLSMKRRKEMGKIDKLRQLPREQDVPLTNRELLIEAEIIKLNMPKIAH